MVITPLGDLALLVTVGEEADDDALARVLQVVQALATPPIPGVVEVVPGLAAVGLLLLRSARLRDVEMEVNRRVAALPVEVPALVGRELEIPVCYGGELGPDLPSVAEQTGLSPAEVVRRHSQPEYRVQAVGFSPGFPYLRGLPAELAVPRRATPRTRVPAGSVGIGGTQTGIYPIETPGGWQLIGRTPRPLFEARGEPPAWLRAGDRVRFVPVDGAEYERLAAGMEEARRAVLHPSEEGRSRPVFTVLRPGVQTTVQDRGRIGWQAQGVPPSGPVDETAAAVANVLVGNTPDAALLEWTLRGPVLRCERDTVVALTGAYAAGFEPLRPFEVRAGQTLDLTVPVVGWRGYVAVAGGIEVPRVLGSQATCVRAQFGGYRGRPLRAGDALAGGAAGRLPFCGGWRASPLWQVTEADEPTVRVLRGPDVERFIPSAWSALTTGPYRVRPESDRMGQRLEGVPLHRQDDRELLSKPIATGAIQVPPDGQPIILLADRQTLGGYPQIGYVIQTDLAVVAQVRPGQRLRFVEISLEEAEAARLTVERDLSLLRLGVAHKLGGLP